MSKPASVLVAACVLLLGSCQAPPRKPTGPIHVASQRLLTVMPLVVVAGQVVELDYEAWGSSGCDRQSATTTTLSGASYSHEYKTWSEGGPLELCTANMVRGGAQDRFEPSRPGTYDGTVVADGRAVAAYTLRVFASAAEAERETLRLLPALSRWELVQLLRQSRSFESGALQEALTSAGATLVRGGIDPKEREAVVAWLETPSASEVVAELAPLVGGLGRFGVAMPAR